MMKKILLFLFVLMMCAVSASAAEWKYLGRFELPDDKTYLRTTDALLLNHLTPCDPNTPKNGTHWFDVYYDHDPATDVYVQHEAYNEFAIYLDAKIVPLSQLGKPMVSDDVYCGDVYSRIVVMTAGVFEARPLAFSIVDRRNGSALFKMEGQMQGQVLFKGSAAEKIANVTGPHKGWERGISGIPKEMIN